MKKLIVLSVIILLFFSATSYANIDDSPPVIDVYGVTNQISYLGQEVVIYSYWKDSSDLETAIIEENSLGYYVIHPVEVSGNESWVNYSIPGQNVQSGKEMRYIIYVNDTYGNNKSISGSFFVILLDDKKLEEVKQNVTCGNIICEENEDYQNCPQDCPKPIINLEGLTTEEITERLTNLLPLITGVMLIIVMIYIALKTK
ncbi:MAG: hypothetical protein ACXACX_17430 [Candidatus Hodarchaeales archaeon]|jgi:hypothetical protein